MNKINNPLLAQVHSIEGAKHQIDRLVQAALREHGHVTDAGWVERKLNSIGVNQVGSDDSLLGYWKRQVKHQMKATHPAPVKPPRTKGPKSLAQKLSHGVGIHTFSF